MRRTLAILLRAWAEILSPAPEPSGVRLHGGTARPELASTLTLNTTPPTEATVWWLRRHGPIEWRDGVWDMQSGGNYL